MLYEPTNIIPSTMTQTGTVAATTDNVNIQWQVNGNSAMTMFQIDVMQNNADSTFVYSTGIVTDNPTVAQGYSLPFYGKDRFGDYVQFVYQPNQTWAAWSSNAILDGNSYKFRITQFFQENGTSCKVPITSNLSAGMTYYFSYSVNGMTQYVSFTVANAAYFVNGNTIYFNFLHNAGWVATSDTHSRAITDITFSVSETQPSGSQLSGAEAVSSGDTFYNQFFTAQNSASSFITRTEPTLTITPLAETPVASATQSFTATYSQAQGDSINTVRWQLFNADDMSTPIDDTGDISTSVLFYEYNGLFDGLSYTVTCTVTTESGVSVSAMLDFSVQYNQGTYTGDFTAQSLCREDANLLEWDSILNIPGVNEPNNSANINGGEVYLPFDATIVWEQMTNADGVLQPLNISNPWCAVWNGDISINPKQIIPFDLDSDGVLLFSAAAFNSTGTLLVAVGGIHALRDSKGKAYWFSVHDNTLSYGGEITGIPDSQSYYFSDVSFNTDGDTLVIVKNDASTKGISYCSITGDNIDYTGEVDLTTFLNPSQEYSYITKAKFCPFSDLLFVCGQTYPVNQNPYTFKYTKKTESGFSDFTAVPGIEENDRIGCFDFNEEGSIMVVAYQKLNDENGILYLGLYSIENENVVLLNTYNFIFEGGIMVDDIAIKNNIVALEYYTGEYNIKLLLFKNEALTVVNDTKLSIERLNSILKISLSNDAKTLFLIGYDQSVGSGISQKGKMWMYKIDNTYQLINGVQTVVQQNMDIRVFTAISVSPNGNLFVVGTQDAAYILCYLKHPIISLPNQNISITKDFGWISITNEDWENYINLSDGVVSGSVMLTPSTLNLYAGNESEYFLQKNISVAYEQSNLASLEIQGEQTCNYVAVVGGDGDNMVPYVSIPGTELSWNNGDIYSVELLANFTSGIDGGTASSTGKGFRIYRRTTGSVQNFELATLPSTTLSLRDYGIKSNKSYIYDFYVYDANGAFMGVRSTEATPLQRQFKRFSLLSAQYNESDNCYHVVKEYQFSCNIQDMTVSNNSNKSYVQNFTPYPTVFQSTANYASGTLQALIGFVDPKAYKYWDSAQLMDELNALSTTTNTLFLKDMKGHLWMVNVGTVQMTTTQKTREMQVTISLPWTEIGDASDVSIIQTPDDEGWNNDAQVLDVKLDVDVETGLLQAVYPFPYNGTAFYLVGVTPEGVVSAVQPLPSTASQPTDGQLKAVVRHK